MSVGTALPAIGEVLPAVDYAPAAQPVGDLVSHAQTFAHPDVAHVPGVADAVHQAAGHMTDAAAQGLHELLAPAAVALGALSGALLAGRAALVTTQVLAAAAVRAAEEQACLERRQEASATAARQWEAAAFAATRANARRAALLARVRRAARTAPPGTPPPPVPGLPGPLAPVGMPLARLRERLAVLDERMRHAEAAHAEWVLRENRNAFTGPQDDAWQRELRARRASVLHEHRSRPDAARDADPSVARRADEALPQPPAAEELRHEDAVRIGAELLARLDVAATAEDAEPAAAAVRHALAAAATRPLKARTHLREARRFVAATNRAVRARRAAEERAAAQLDFLETTAPQGTDPLPPVPAETALLRRVLDEGRRLEPHEQRQVDDRVSERLAELERRYVERMLRLAISGTDRFDGRTADSSHPHGRLVRFDWTPPGWGAEHWLRIALDGEHARVATMRREAPGARDAAALALDDERCHEADGHLEQLRGIAQRLGVELDFAFEESGTVPGTRGEEGVLVLDEDTAGARRPEPSGKAREEHRRRSDDRPGHRTVRTDGR
ncbi:MULTISPECIES: hypothetical protein [unclassified Streptomyces]|uniref:hypothetical protein n=1 Tax=unclassified Streptomyces TaxID=2593676 RepID=UPI000F5BFCF0|nr:MULTISPECIES: hypothetical protein [unclassified Streptomyces]MCX5101822.1 hypothetical protein [Streptomyces sp. NBC_00439]RPK68744.1 hypothetical protein EES42_20695 [Streptomyces sp. ADI95-17]